MQRIYDSHGLTEEEFLRQYATKNYPKPSLTADNVILSPDEEGYSVLLIRRKNHPYIDFWALPGGFANPNETIEQTAARELAEETGVQNLSLRLVGVYSKPGRDPRGWVISVAYCAVVSASDIKVLAGDDAGDAAWFHINNKTDDLCLSQPAKADFPAVLQLAFDHNKILTDALKLIEENIRG